MADSYAPADVKPAKKMTKAEQGTFITELREKLDAAINPLLGG